MFCKTLVYFIVPGDRLFHSILRINVNIVPGTISKQYATLGC